mgnify:CR=1 FL=1
MYGNAILFFLGEECKGYIVLLIPIRYDKIVAMSRCFMSWQKESKIVRKDKNGRSI